MPVIKSAKKKLKQDRKRTLENKKFQEKFKSLVKKAQKTATQKSVSEAFKALDKSTKKGILHKNKASRIKSRLSRLLDSKKASKK